MTENDEFFLDGNAAAGALIEWFGAGATAATGQCDHCGHVAAIGEARVYDPQHGMVLRCTGCDGILMRIVEDESRVWLDLRGLTYLEVHKDVEVAEGPRRADGPLTRASGSSTAR